MKYAKPELRAIMAAVSAIQGVGKGSGQFETIHTVTTPAYEADE